MSAYLDIYRRFDPPYESFDRSMHVVVRNVPEDAAHEHQICRHSAGVGVGNRGISRHDLDSVETCLVRPPGGLLSVGRVLLDKAAEILGVSRRTVYYRIREGRLRTIRTRCGSQRVLMESIEALLRERMKAPTDRTAGVSDTDPCERCPEP